MKRLSHRAEHLAQPGRLRGRQAQRPDHLLLGEADEFSDGGRRAEYADRAGHVPADVVVRRVDDVPDARGGLESQDECLDEVATAHAVGAGIGKERGAHRRARVAVVLGRRVVVVLDVRADAVHQRGVKRIEPLDPVR